MPKLKTRKAAAKRFRFTATGKIMRRSANRNHLLQHKSAERKRRLWTLTQVDESDEKNVRAMLPYSS